MLCIELFIQMLHNNYLFILYNIMSIVYENFMNNTLN